MDACALKQPKTVITAHTAADMDALASMVAAGKLYPEALLIAPPRNERQSGNYFVDSIGYIFDFVQPKDCDFSRVETLVLVDTRLRERVPHVEEVFANPGLKIHVYDHHPPSPDDLPAETAVIRPWGSATAVLALLLRDKGVLLLPDEATMLGLGLYEDTGNFTYQSTTRYDFEAAAWLCSQGMDLEIVPSLNKNKFTSDEVQILNDLLEHAVLHEIKGIPVMVTEASAGEYVNDVSSLVGIVMNMENVAIIFALVRMGDRIQMVARSGVPGKVNAAAVCAAFGGGGHPTAAAASIKNKTIPELKSELYAVLLANVNTEEITAGQKMSYPPKVVEASRSMSEASAMMLRSNLKVLPVVEDGGMRCIGILEYQTAAMAVNHKIGNQPVADYMNSRPVTIKRAASLYPVLEPILSQRQRLVPVLDDDGDVVGVITRTDVVRLLMDKAFKTPVSSSPAGEGSGQRERNAQDLLSGLPSNVKHILSLAGKTGDALGVSVYTVGGFVRDLFLHVPNLDIDLCVEGKAFEFASALARELDGRLRTHAAFQTAIVLYTDESGREQRLDVATTRQEYYEAPGLLPVVELSSIGKDLYRRDFTINALAVQLNKARFGLVADFFGGQRDIKEKYIRVLHSLSFIEDQTRILRAIRFEKRYNFRIEPQTEKLIKNCLRLNMLEQFSGARLFNELRHVFDEARPLPCMQRMEQLGVWQAICPLLRLHPDKEELAAGVEEMLSWHRLLYTEELPRNWIPYLMAMCAGFKYQEMSEVLQRFNLSDKLRHEVLTIREDARRADSALPQWKKKDGSPSGLHAILKNVALEGLLFLAAKSRSPEIRRDLSHYISSVRGMKTDINGADVISLGLDPGPGIGETLQRVLEAKMDGLAPNRENQLELASAIIKALGERKQDKADTPETSGGIN